MFTELKDTIKETSNLNIQISYHQKSDTYTLKLYPENLNSKLQAVSASGTAEQLDAEFVQLVAKPIEILVRASNNLEAMQKSIDEAKKAVTKDASKNLSEKGKQVLEAKKQDEKKESESKAEEAVKPIMTHIDNTNISKAIVDIKKLRDRFGETEAWKKMLEEFKRRAGFDAYTLLDKKSAQTSIV